MTMIEQLPQKFTNSPREEYRKALAIVDYDIENLRKSIYSDSSAELAPTEEIFADLTEFLSYFGLSDLTTLNTYAVQLSESEYNNFCIGIISRCKAVVIIIDVFSSRKDLSEQQYQVLAEKKHQVEGIETSYTQLIDQRMKKNPKAK